MFFCFFLFCFCFVFPYKTCLWSQAVSFNLSTPWESSTDDNVIILFSYFSKRTGFTIETICMKCQILFSGEKKNEKYFNMAENFTQYAKH